MKIKLTAITLIVGCLITWAISHFAIPTFGIESPSGAYGVVIERGSVLLGADDHAFAAFKPFMDVLSYEGYLGERPTALETIKGRIAFGPDPRYPWVTGVALPMWSIGLVLLLLMLTFQVHHHSTTRA